MVKINQGQVNANAIQIGDYVIKSGVYTNPAVVVEKKDDGSVVMDTDKEQINKFHRHSNTSGLSVEEKEKFNLIMDDIMSDDNKDVRLNKLQDAIDSLKTEKGSKRVIDTLRNEQAQLIRMTKELPRTYNYEASKLAKTK